MSNVCSCPKPPGGKVTCQDDQLAICGYRNGEIVSGCFDRPKATRLIEDKRQKNLVLANWVLSTITGIDRSDYQHIDTELVKLLSSGRYTDPRTGEILRFGLPKDLQLDFPQAMAAY